MTGPRIVGEAAIRIVPDASDWGNRVRAQLDPQADEIGRSIGRAIGDHLYRQVADSIDEIDARLAILGTRDVRIRLRIDDNGSIARSATEVAGIGDAASNSGGGVNLLSGHLIGMGAAALAGADLAIPAILAIGAAVTGLAAGMGVGMLGFSGISEALQAKGSPYGGGGGGGGGGQSAQQQQIAEQQRRLQATQSTRSAQDQLTQAIQTQADAEKNLHDARVQAALDIIDLDNKLRDNQLAQQQNAITLDEARKKLAVMLAAPGAGLPQYADQIAQAKLDVATALQKQKELSEQGKQLSTQDTAAHKAGVEGAAGVVKAKQQLVDANHKLAEAHINVTETAQKNRLAEEAAAASLASSAGSADKFATAMANLNPLQQQFVDFLISLKPLFEEVKLAASGFLPGLEQGIKDALPAFEPFLQLVGNVAHAMGDVFVEFGQAIGSQQGQQFVKFLAVELPKQITFLGKLFLDWGQTFAKVFQAAGPLIDATDQAILAFFDHTNRAAGSSGLTTFFDSLIPLMPKVTDALIAIADLLGNLLSAIEPALGPTLDLITQLASELASIAEPILRPLAKAFGDLMAALSPLVPVISGLIKTILPPLIKLLDVIIKDGVAPLATAIAKALLPVLPTLSKALTDIVNAIIPLVEPLVHAIAPIIAPLAKAFVQLVQAIAPFIPQLVNMFKALLPLVAPLAKIAEDAVKLVTDALPLMQPLLAAFAQGIPPLVSALTPLLNLLDKLLGFVDALLNKLPQLPGISDSGGPFGNSLGGFGSALGGHAGGGNMLAGQPSVVGEVGPEIFVPRVPGTMIPADAARILGKALDNKPSRTNNFQIFTNDPLAAAHATANRFAARGA